MKKFLGDKGKSELLNKKKIYKDNLIFEVLGDLDELNSFLGLTKNFIRDKKLKSWIVDIQKDAFRISAVLVGAGDRNFKKIIEELDEKLEFCLKSIPIPKHFVLSGASLGGACLDYSRAISRRVERRIVALKKIKKINPEILIYFNHLSKFLFFFARLIDKKIKIRF